jgi:pimeloyl-ACP methyl ester carboxylesterase
MKAVTVHGLKIACEITGDGPPLVLLHGFLADSRAWCPQIRGLAGSVMVIAWDTPGCGASSDPPEHWRMTEYVDCLAGFLDELGIGAAHVCGLSWGGGTSPGILWPLSRSRSLVGTGGHLRGLAWIPGRIDGRTASELPPRLRTAGPRLGDVKIMLPRP